MISKDTIFIIEDESHRVRRVKKALQKQGFNVVSTDSISQAILALEKTDSFSMIFLEKRTKHFKILIVEDDQSLVSIIRHKFEQKGFLIETSKTVDEALYCLYRDQSIDAIWLDHYLSAGETGLDFIEGLKKGKLRKVPIFVISNADTLGELQLYQASGIIKYYAKDYYSLDYIIKEIQSFLTKGHLNS